MTGHWRLTGTRMLTVVALGAMFTGCTSMPWDSAPFYGNAPARPTTLNTVPVPAGFYRVNPGDTLAGIASAYGHKPQDIAAWNGLAANAIVNPGQVLRVSPPMASGSVVTPPVGVAGPNAPAAPAQRPGNQDFGYLVDPDGMLVEFNKGATENFWGHQHYWHEQPLCAAADELHSSSQLSDQTWAALRAVLSDEQLVELPMLVGNYVMVSYLLNALRVANDSGVEMPDRPGQC